MAAPRDAFPLEKDGKIVRLIWDVVSYSPIYEYRLWFRSSGEYWSPIESFPVGDRINQSWNELQCPSESCGLPIFCWNWFPLCGCVCVCVIFIEPGQTTKNAINIIIPAPSTSSTSFLHSHSYGALFLSVFFCWCCCFLFYWPPFFVSSVRAGHQRRLRHHRPVEESLRLEPRIQRRPLERRPRTRATASRAGADIESEIDRWRTGWTFFFFWSRIRKTLTWFWTFPPSPRPPDRWRRCRRRTPPSWKRKRRSPKPTPRTPRRRYRSHSFRGQRGPIKGYLQHVLRSRRVLTVGRAGNPNSVTGFFSLEEMVPLVKKRSSWLVLVPYRTSNEPYSFSSPTWKTVGLRSFNVKR